MDAILNFLVNNYLWFLIISLILIFALIGYIVDNHEKKAPKLHFNNNEDIEMDATIASQDKSLKEMIEENDKIIETKNEEEGIVETTISLDNPVKIDDSNEKSELPEV